MGPDDEEEEVEVEEAEAEGRAQEWNTPETRKDRRNATSLSLRQEQELRTRWSLGESEGILGNEAQQVGCERVKVCPLMKVAEQMKA